MSKFKKKPFKKWLDALAAVVVKTRDDYQCQLFHDPACAGKMSPGDRNCQCCHIISRAYNQTRWDLLNLLTGCAHCHSWAHKNPVEFGVHFANHYSYRWDYISRPYEPKTWRQADFEEWEEYLLNKAIDLNVVYLHIRTEYQKRLKRRLEETRKERK